MNNKRLAVTELGVFPCVGPVDNGCHFLAMFLRGRIGGQDEAHTSDPLQVSPKRQDLQNEGSESPGLRESFGGKQELEDKPPHDLLSVHCTIRNARISPAGENRGSPHHDGCAAEDCANSGTKNDARQNKSLKEGGQVSGNIVEHILKELKGINKIQEEISDLREYLTSVRGSVDEVSCCVDAVLSEIGDLYCGASAGPQPSPVPQKPRIRRGSLGRQNAVTCLHERDPSPLLDNSRECGKDSDFTPSKRSTDCWKDDKEAHGVVHQISYAGCGRDYRSTSSWSSCHSSNYRGVGSPSGDTESNIWHRGEAGWSEEDVFSCADLENGLEGWEKELQSRAACPSNASSEKLHLLFGERFKASSCSSSMVGWRTPTEGNECDCATNCPFSRSPGYCKTDPRVNDFDSEPSRSLSCSTMLLTDCDDGYPVLNSPCDEYPSSADTLDLGSAESLDREWTDQSISREEVLESLSQASSEMDSETIPQTPNDRFDETISSGAAIASWSPSKGDVRTLEVSNHKGVKDDANSDSQLFPSSLTQFNEPRDVHPAANYLQYTFPTRDSGTSQSQENTSFSPQELPTDKTLTVCLSTKCNSADIAETTAAKASNVELSSFDMTRNHSPAARAQRPLEPISENGPPAEGDRGKPTDPSHRERISNFQRILREKRRTNSRLAKSTQGSQGSYASQGSQGSQSQDEFFPGNFKLFLFSDFSHNPKNTAKIFKEICRCINNLEYNGKGNCFNQKEKLI